MSGRWLTVLAVSGCVALVSFALWQRARTTQHVREFWGPQQASLIQHGKTVRLRSSKLNSTWQDISHAPGLVHLRATLVDDRYYQWNASASATTSVAPQTEDAKYLLEFSEAGSVVELTIAPTSGTVTNLARGQSVPLIPASQQAVAAYLEEIVE